MPVEYRFSGAVIARVMGAVMVGAGALVLLLALLVSLLGLPSAVLSVGVVVALLAFLATGLLLTPVASVVHLDETGYRVRFVRGAGVTRAPWTDVEDVVASTVAGERCVVLRLRDGRTTTMPVDALQGSVGDFVQSLRHHLNQGHGYRPLG